MAIVALAKMLADARSGGYTISYCESWNLESLQATVEAAEECRSPIIAGFNGGFLRHQSRTKPEELTYYAGLRLALEHSPIPIAFLLNESDSLDQIELGIRLGFNAVMPDDETLPADQHLQFVHSAVKVAHKHDVWVEAQLGVLPHGDGNANGHAEITDPETARRFVESTGIDALAVSVGNVHVLTSGRASINLDALRRIAEKVAVPLVVHGGTSIAHENLQAFVRVGVAKFNFGTLLKQAYLEAVRSQLALYEQPMNPHAFLGIGGDKDIMVAGRNAVKAKVRELLRICGSAGKVA